MWCGQEQLVGKRKEGEGGIKRKLMGGKEGKKKWKSKIYVEIVNKTY